MATNPVSVRQPSPNIDVRKDAEVSWITVQEQGEEATHLGQLNVTLGENAKLTLFVVNLSGKVVRQEINADVTGEGADLTVPRDQPGRR